MPQYNLCKVDEDSSPIYVQFPYHNKKFSKTFIPFYTKKWNRQTSFKKALNFLNSNQGSQSRKYSELKVAPCVCPNEEEMNIDTAKFLAKIRTHTIEKCQNQI